MVGRFDKTSLLIVCPETTLGEAAIKAQRLTHKIAGTHLKQLGHHKPLTVSIGISAYPDHGNAPVDLLGAAMEAAQNAVASGGNCVCLSQASAVTQDFSPPRETITPPSPPTEAQTNLGFPSANSSINPIIK
jgi:hypothetical protein